MNIAEIRNHLADAINRVAYAGERIILKRRGKGIVALVSMEDLALLEEMENKAELAVGFRRDHPVFDFPIRHPVFFSVRRTVS